MNIRLDGSTAEVAAALELLAQLDDVRVLGMSGGSYAPNGDGDRQQRVNVRVEVREAPSRPGRNEYRRDDEPDDAPLPPGVVGHQLGGRNHRRTA